MGGRRPALFLAFDLSQDSAGGRGDPVVALGSSLERIVWQGVRSDAVAAALGVRFRYLERDTDIRFTLSLA